MEDGHGATVFSLFLFRYSFVSAFICLHSVKDMHSLRLRYTCLVRLVMRIQELGKKEVPQVSLVFKGDVMK